MKNIALILLFSMISYSAFSQQQDNKKAQAILDKVTAKTESYKSIRMEFTYKMENKEANIDESKEGMIILKGNKFRLIIAGQLVISDGETVWTYIAEAEEVQINSVEEDDESINLNKILTSYSENYKSKFIKSTVENGVNVKIIDLVPTEGKSYFKIRLVINEAKAQILKSTIYDKNGSTYTYEISKFIANPVVSEKDFTFNASDYPDVEIVDMR